MNTIASSTQGSSPVPDELYQRFIGVYGFASGRQFLLTRQGLGEKALYLYAQDDALVRLFPHSFSQFVTDRGETLTLAGEQGSEHLLLQDAQGEVQQARRVHAYEEEFVQFAGSAQQILAGSLLKPPGPGPYPAVALFHLANVHERDYYRIYAQQFVQQGMAALIYDKRGHGASTGDPLSSEIFELIDDAEAAFCFLQHHSAIDRHAVGVWGMSNGGWVDLGVATKHPEVAFVMNLSASGVPPSRQEQIRRVNVSRLKGASPEQLHFLERFWELVFAFEVHNVWTDELALALQRLQLEPEWNELLKETSDCWLLDVPLEQFRREYGGMWPDGGFDPAPLYAQLRCPVLCLWGQEDTVLPVTESVASIQEALQASTHPDWTVRIFPHANHLLYLNRLDTDALTNELLHEQLRDIQFPANLFESITSWLRQRP